MRDEKLHAVVARSTFRSENAQNTPSSDHFWKLMSKKCTPLWREAHFEVKMYITHQVRTTFGSCDVEKVHAVVARSTFRSQNVQNTPFSDHFWKLMSKSARRCGAKHISKSKCAKHTILGPLLEVEMSKKCTPLWREAHFEVKMYKATPFSDHFWKFGSRKSARRCGAKHILKSKCLKTPGIRTTFGGSDVTSLRFTTSLQYTTLRYAPLHYTALHYTTLHNTTTTTTQLHSTTLHYTKLHYTILHYITLHYTPLHYTTLRYTIH